MNKVVCSILLIVTANFSFSISAEEKVKLKWNDVSAFDLRLGHGTLNNFRKNRVFTTFNESKYETDFGLEEALILVEDEMENRLYFSEDSKTLSSFNLHSCLIKLKGITIEATSTYLDVLEQLNRFEISTNISPTKDKTGSIWLRLAPATDEYLIIEFSNNGNRVERCRTWLDN